MLQKLSSQLHWRDQKFPNNHQMKATKILADAGLLLGQVKFYLSSAENVIIEGDIYCY